MDKGESNHITRDVENFSDAQYTGNGTSLPNSYVGIVIKFFEMWVMD